MPRDLIAARPGCYGKFQSEAFRHLAEIGIKHVELGSPPEKDWPAVKADLAKHGLSASSVGHGIDLSKPESVASFEHTARCAMAFGAKIIFLSVKSGGRPLPDCYTELRGLGETARAHGATIALETHPDLVTNGDVGVATAKGTNHPYVKLNYDSANLYYYNENIDGIPELKKFLPWLGAVHLKETDGKPKSWYFPGLHEGRGIVNFPEIFRLCHEAGFYGPFTLEIEGCEGENLTQEQTLQRMANTAAYLRSIGAL